MYVSNRMRAMFYFHIEIVSLSSALLRDVTAHGGCSFGGVTRSFAGAQDDTTSGCFPFLRRDDQSIHNSVPTRDIRGDASVTGLSEPMG
jgi:hypothetical protein